MGTTEDNKNSLMETLQAQQDLLQQLYTELDVEREASATATDQSLSMILRLQGEKSAVEMEATQYKRIAEQKMCYTQETLEKFRDLIYQKEMQIASLEFQVQAYKFKLVSLGCKDVGEIETTFPLNMLSRGNSLPKNQGFTSRAYRRGCSLPPNFLEDGVDPNPPPEKTNSDLVQSKSGDFSSYWQQIKRLDERVKELSLHSLVSTSSFNDPLTNGGGGIEVRQPLLGMDLIGDSSDPPKVHDVFEVPEALNSEAEIMTVKVDSIKSVVSGVMDKNNWNVSGVMDKNNWNVQRPPLSTLSSDIDKQLNFKRPDATDFELQQMNRRLKRLEDERITVRQETAPGRELAFEEDDYKLMLLKDIKDQLNSMEDEILSWRPTKSPPKKEPEVACLKEAMLHFWS